MHRKDADSIVAQTSGGRLRTTVSSNDPLVTRNDAAVFLTVSLRQVDRLIADGTLAAVRIGERSIRIRRSALEALLVPVIHGPRWPPRRVSPSGTTAAGTSGRRGRMAAPPMPAVPAGGWRRGFGGDPGERR